MDDDGFASFRAAHPDLLDAPEKCERPDWLIQLAWDAGLDRRAVINEGLDDAGLLLATEWNSTVALFWPFSRPLEAVEVWCESLSMITKNAAGIRPHASAVIPGCVAGMLLATFFVAPRMSGITANLLILVICLACIAVIGLLFKVLIARGLRRQIARLDEERAFAIVLHQLRVGMKTSPKLVPYTTTRTAKYLKQLVATRRRG